MVLRMENPVAEPQVSKKRKREPKPSSDTKKNKSDTEKLSSMKVINKKIKSAPPVLYKQVSKLEPILEAKDKKEKVKDTESISKDIIEKYPILKNEELVQKFLAVSMTNNQKGRIRQLLKDSLKGTSEFLLPDVIHSRIQAIIKSSTNLSETELRKIRILYNMLKTAVAAEKTATDNPKKKNKKSKKKTDKKDDTQIKNEENTKATDAEVKVESNADIKSEIIEKAVEKTVAKKKDKERNEKNQVLKVKGPKRYVVFVGNLPPDIKKEQILQHFKEFNECIVDIRIPQRPEGKKSSIAYVELKNEPSYELALSKHHSMLGSKRINVLYTTQKNGKVSKTEAKSKSAKLIALQKAGKLIGSIPVNRKRSHRRMKMKRAQAKLAAESA